MVDRFVSTKLLHFGGNTSKSKMPTKEISPERLLAKFSGDVDLLNSYTYLSLMILNLGFVCFLFL